MGAIVVPQRGDKVRKTFRDKTFSNGEAEVTVEEVKEGRVGTEVWFEETKTWVTLADFEDGQYEVVSHNPGGGITWDPSASSAREAQVGGNHYSKLKIQPYEYTLANNLGGLEHTIIKYVTRWQDKGGVEDLKKARHTIDFLIEYVEKNGMDLGATQND